MALMMEVIVAQFSVPSNTVVVHGIRFGILDDTNPSETTLGCQETALSGPTESSGWKIANSANPIHRMAVASYPWGTSCLVLENGISLSSQTLFPCSNSSLITSGEYLSVSTCDQRILLYQEDPVPLEEFFEHSSFSSSCTNSWVSESDNISCSNKHLQMTIDDTSLHSVSQEIDISKADSSIFESGFIFAIKSSCPSELKGLERTAEITVGYKKGETTKTVSFGACDNELASETVSLLPSKRVRSITVRFSAQGTSSDSGIVTWSSFKLLPLENLLINPSFQGTGIAPLVGWNDLGFMPDLPRQDDDDSYFVSSILLTLGRIESEHDYQLQGSNQLVGGEDWAESDLIRSIYVGGWSKTYEMTGTPDDNFGISVDVEYTDGTALYGQVVSFPTGSHDWIYSDAVIQLKEPVLSLNVSVLLRGHTGVAWVDHIFVSALQGRATPLECSFGAFGASHINTLSNQVLSGRTPGEYFLMKTSDHKDIQTRHVTFQESVATLISGVGVRIDTENFLSIQFDEVDSDGWTDQSEVNGPPSVYVNGELQTELENCCILLPGLGVLTREDFFTNSPVYLGGDVPTSASSSSAVDSSAASPASPESPESPESPVSSSTESTEEDNSIPLLPDEEKDLLRVEGNSDSEYEWIKVIQAYTYHLEMEDGRVNVYARYLLDDDENNEIPTKIAGYLQVVASFEGDVCSSDMGGLAADEELGEEGEWKITAANSLFQYQNHAETTDFYQPLGDEISEPSFSAECEHYAVVDCAREASSAFNSSCIEDVLLLTNPFIIQNYHTIEADLGLVAEALSVVSVQDRADFFVPDTYSESTSRFTLIVIVSVLLVAAVFSITIFYKRKKTRRTAPSAVPSAVELEEMLTQNDRAEMFE